MSKRKIFLILLLTISSMLFGQGLKDDLDAYAEQMEVYQDLVSNPTIERLIEGISNNDTQALYDLIDFLQGDYLSSLYDYIQMIIEIKPQTIKVKFLHTQFIESYDALYRALSAASRIDKEALKQAENDIETAVPDEYNEFIFGLNLFSIKLNTYNALNKELSFLVQFE